VLASVTVVDAANSSSTAAVATCVSYHLTEFAVDSGGKTSSFSFQPNINSRNGDSLTAHDIFSALKVLRIPLLLLLVYNLTRCYNSLHAVHDI
jgi:hypothetical protein